MPATALSGTLVEALGAGFDDASREKRTDWLMQVVDLLRLASPSLTEGHLSLFDHVIEYLSEDIAFRVRVELADKLAPLSMAPPRILERLARDPEIDVASPILRHSPCLAEEVLLAIAGAGGEDKRCAIAQRATLKEELSQVILLNSEGPGVRLLVENAGARFSYPGWEQVAAWADRDEVIGQSALRRSDLPAALVGALTVAAEHRANAALAGERQTAGPRRLAGAVARAGDVIRATRNSVALDFSFESALSQVDALRKTTKIGEAEISAWLSGGQPNHALAAIARRTSLSPAAVRRAFHAQHVDELLFIIKSIPLSFETYRQLLQAKLGRELDAGFEVDAAESFRRLSVETAKRVTAFLATRQENQIPKT